FSYLIFFNIFRLSEKLTLALNIKKLSWALTLIPVGFYALLAGLPVSTQRAFIMVATFVLAYLLDRSRDIYATLALAALAVLLLHPGSLWDASFQFSFTAVFAIFYLVPRFDKIFSRRDTEGIKTEERAKFKWLTHRIRTLIFITLAASIATAPLSIYHFNNLPLLGMPLNLIVVPVVSLIIVPLSLLYALLIPISESLAALFFNINDIFINAIVSLVKALSSPAWSHIKVSTITKVELASFYLIIFVLLNLKKRRYLLYALPLLITALTFPTVISYYQSVTSKELKVTFINVGQGEASLIEFPGGSTMLIDGGASYNGGFDMGEMVISKVLRAKRIRKIDYVVMSHSQRDHKGGLAFLIRSFNIGEFWWNGKGKIPQIAKALKDKNRPSLIIDASSKEIDIGGVLIDVLNPKAHGSEEISLNEASLVIKLTYKGSSVLFTGDVGLETEAELIEGFNLEADILKAAHHGSRYSSSTAFLDEVTPKYVVISAGIKNSYGFPHKEALERFKSSKANIYRTDRHGAVEAIINGKDIKVNAITSPLLPI
ncbi:MAG: DNA internalization-related competence protein ComEC/Rec2, partial [Proteobacteria bacterium]|nr:DNA internalization-related competence protein ComEC/Rec2 [Pseudomonadota bacterium]